MLASKPIKYLYSLHKKVNKQPFVVHLMRPDDTYRTTLLSFTINRDAVNLANVFQQYKIEHGNYPDNQFTFETPFKLEYETKNDFTIKEDLPDIEIQHNTEEFIYEWCMEQQMDLMIIYDIENVGKLQVVEFEIPTDVIRERLENNLK